MAQTSCCLSLSSGSFDNGRSADARAQVRLRCRRESAVGDQIDCTLDHLGVSGGREGPWAVTGADTDTQATVERSLPKRLGSLDRAHCVGHDHGFVVDVGGDAGEQEVNDLGVGVIIGDPSDPRRTA